MYKNLTLRQITIFITFTLTIIFVAVLLIFKVTNTLIFPWYYILVIALVQLLASYLVVKNFLERFVFRKIKLIYKFIYDSKLGPSSSKKNVDFNETSLEDINDEVIRWGERKEEEIETLKTLEDYRKNFVGNISHELKTPIFSIQGYLHTLLDGGLYDNSINNRYLERAASNADRLQRIVDDLEVVARYESGNQSLEFLTFNIKVLIEEVFSDLQVLADEKSISLIFKANADQGFEVKADREAIRQVLNNLIVNSIKYGKENGVTKLSMYDVDKNILIEVSDNGIGLDDVHIKHVFDRFYRVDTSRSRSQGGSGLGLSIVKHIIEGHKQTITVRSTKDVGSTFGFTLEKA